MTLDGLDKPVVKKFALMAALIMAFVQKEIVFASLASLENTAKKNPVVMTVMVMEDAWTECVYVIKDGKAQTVLNDLL